MTPLRVVGLMVVVFLVSLPVTFLVEGGPSIRMPSFTDSEGEGGSPREEKDDPVVDVLCLKALQAASEGEFNKAIATYTKAIQRDPKYAFAYIGRGDAYAASGDLDAYWRYHLRREHERIHHAKYRNTYVLAA